MIDKAEQRRRAAEMSQQLQAQGVQPPKLTYPVSKPKASKPDPRIAASVAQTRKTGVKAFKLDAVGQPLQVNDIVVTTVDGIVSVLRKGRICRMTKDRVEVEVSNNDGTFEKVLKYPLAVAKVS